MNMHDDSYELFRRAIVDRDEEAWTVIVSRYRNLMILWAGRCQTRYGVQESKEDLADRALARAWTAFAPERFAAFPNTHALLAYIRTCVTTTAIDAARSQAAFARVLRPAEWYGVATVEQTALENLGRNEFWQAINKVAMGQAEWIALVERFVLDLPPRTIQERHPTLFHDVTFVYAAIRNACNRLRRNQDFCRLYGAQAAA